MTSFLPSTCSVCVAYEGRMMASLSSPRGLKPATATQNDLWAHQRDDQLQEASTDSGGCGGWPSMRKGGYASGLSS